MRSGITHHENIGRSFPSPQSRGDSCRGHASGVLPPGAGRMWSRGDRGSKWPGTSHGFSNSMSIANARSGGYAIYPGHGLEHWNKAARLYSRRSDGFKPHGPGYRRPEHAGYSPHAIPVVTATSPPRSSPAVLRSCSRTTVHTTRPRIWEVIVRRGKPCMRMRSRRRVLRVTT